MTLQVQPLGGALGARVTGADIAGGLGDADFRVIRQALLDHHVVAVPDQRLSAADLVAFSRRFGDLEPHLLGAYHHPELPEVLMLSNATGADGKPKGIATPPDPEYHSDLSYRPRPTWVTLLFALQVPDAGGDTLFADMVKAYETLPEDLKTRLDGLQAAHNYAYRYPERLTAEQRAATPDVAHPVVRTHPESGKRALFINPSFTGPILGLPGAESDRLKRRVYDHCLQDRFLLRYRWRNGDLVMWDNAAVIHSATEAPSDQERTLMRTTVVGGVPV